MNPESYYRSLSKAQRIEWATQAGTTLRYVQSMFVAKGSRKRPRDRLIIGLVNASEGQVGLGEAIDYFLIQPVRKLAAELESSQHHVTAKQVAAELKGFDGADKPESFYQQANSC